MKWACLFNSIKLYCPFQNGKFHGFFADIKCGYYICGDPNTHTVYAYSAEKTNTLKCFLHNMVFSVKNLKLCNAAQTLFLYNCVSLCMVIAL